MKRLFEGNTFLKIASILIATTLWFYINSRGISEITISVPLEIINLPDGYETLNNRVNEIHLGLKGHERLIKNLNLQNVRAFLDLSKPKEGWSIYYINKDNLKTPPSIDIVKIDPSAVKLKIDRTISKKVIVNADLKGAVQRGFLVRAVTVTPRAVTIEGTKSVVEKVHQMRTEIIDLTGRSASFEEDSFVIVEGENVRLVTDKVRVQVEIARSSR
ncbi:MAG: CdaR family protein [Thermodesulfovibrionales bacterium]